MKLQDLATSRKDVYLIPLGKIRDDPRNPREDFSRIPDLALSMFNMGQLEICEVRISVDGEYADITAGHRRKRAAIYVNEHFDEWSKEHINGHRFEGLYCRSEPKIEGKVLTPDQRLVRQLNQGDEETVAVPLTPLERAKGYKRLMESGMSYVEIGRQMHKSAQQIANLMCLVDAPKALQDAVERGETSPTAAAKAMKASPEKKAAAIEKAERGEKVEVKDVADYVPLSLTEARKVVKKYRNYAFEEKSASGKARWEALARGVEIGVGLRPDEY